MSNDPHEPGDRASATRPGHIASDPATRRVMADLDTVNGFLARSFEAIITVDIDGTILFFNPAAETLFGYTAAEIVGQSMDLLVPERFRARHAQFLAAFNATAESSRVMGRTGEIPARHRDGSEFHAEGTISKLHRGDRVYFTTVMRDVSIRHEAERKLQASEEKHRAIFDSAPDAILVANSDTGIIREANMAAAEMFGCAPTDLVGLHQEMLHPADERTAYRRLFREHIEDGRIHVPDAVVQAADGTPRPVSISARPTRIADEHVTVGFFRDISDLKEREHELAEARDAAEAANQAKSDFLASMSHELRTPLNGILGFADMLRCELHGALGHPRYVEYAGNIHASGQYLLQTIEEILDYSKLDSGNYTLNETWFPMEPAIVECLDMIRSAAQQEAIALELAVSPEIPALRADRHAVKQVLMNLLSNAVKFTPADGRVTVAAERIANGGFALSVADTGVGIPPDRQREMFERFAQGTSAKLAAHKGTGLGLTVARHIMEMHDGDLTMESAEGAGTTVTAVFPAARVESRDSA